MKKYLLINFLIVLFGNLIAQNNFKEFAPIGATWYYDRQEMQPYDARGYIRYTVEGDTLIDSKNMRIVSINGAKSDINESLWGYTYVYVENSKVYTLIDNELRLVFDYSLQPGDTLKVEVNNYACDSISPILLDSIGLSIYKNDTLKIQYFSYTQRYFEQGPEFEKKTYNILEKIGCVSEFLGFPECDFEGSWTSTDLRCYHDDELHYVAKWWSNDYPNAACDEIINEVSVADNQAVSHIKVYPTPVIDFLNIDFKGNDSMDAQLDLYNIYGVKLWTKKNCAKLNMQYLPAGVYLLNIKQNNEHKVFKIIKNAN